MGMTENTEMTVGMGMTDVSRRGEKFFARTDVFCSRKVLT